MPKQKRIFVSATSRDLGSYRKLAAESMRKRRYDVDDQAIFNLTYHQIGEMLKRRIDHCDAVVCLIGFVYGGEPKDRPPGQPRRSYTQWEYYLARELKKPVYRLLANGETKFDDHEQESDELVQLQKDYRAEVIRDRDWRSFNSVDQLRAELAELRFEWEGPPPDHKPCNLPFASIGTLNAALVLACLAAYTVRCLTCARESLLLGRRGSSPECSIIWPYVRLNCTPTRRQASSLKAVNLGPFLRFSDSIGQISMAQAGQKSRRQTLIFRVLRRDDLHFHKLEWLKSPLYPRGVEMLGLLQLAAFVLTRFAQGSAYQTC